MRIAYIHNNKASAAIQKRLNAFLFDGGTVDEYNYNEAPGELADMNYDVVLFDTASNDMLKLYAQWGLISMCEIDGLWFEINPVDEFKSIYKTRGIAALIDRCADNPRGFIHPIAKILTEANMFCDEKSAADYLWDGIYC